MRRTMMLLALSVAIGLVGCATKPRTPPPPPFVPPPPPQAYNPPPGALVVPPGQAPRFPTVPNGSAPQAFPQVQQPQTSQFPQAPPTFQQAPPNFQQQPPPNFQQAPPNFQQQAPPNFQQQPTIPSVPQPPPSVPQPPPSVPQAPPGPDPLLQPRSSSPSLGPLEQAGYNWRPSEVGPNAKKPSGPPLESQVLLLPPEPAKEKDAGARFYPEDNKEAARPPIRSHGKSPPVSIPKFQSVRKNVESGMRPITPEGYDWLAANGYKTVLFLRFPGSSDEIDRKLVEERNMKFLSLEVKTSELLERDRDMMKEFFGYVQTESLQPMYVYGQEEILTGGMWYLVFRLVERDTEEVALVRASTLGLRPGEGAAKETFNAFVAAGKTE